MEDFFGKHKKTQWPDQDCLNAFFAGKTLFLDGDFNRQDGKSEAEEDLPGKIWHMIATKPWDCYSRPWVDDLYWKYLALTPYCPDAETMVHFIFGMFHKMKPSPYEHRHSSDCLRRLKRQMAENILRPFVRLRELPGRIRWEMEKRRQAREKENRKA